MLDYSKRKCYGFVKNNSEEFIINESEAQNVKLIFECFLKGMSLSEIANELYSKGISSPSGKDMWSRKVLSGVLSNEKYYRYGIVSESTFEIAQLEKAGRTKVTVTVDVTSDTESVNECDAALDGEEKEHETVERITVKVKVQFDTSDADRHYEYRFVLYIFHQGDGVWKILFIRYCVFYRGMLY